MVMGFTLRSCRAARVIGGSNIGLWKKRSDLPSDVTLGQARQKGEGARKLLANGVDPSFAKKEQKRQATLNAENTFAVAPPVPATRPAHWIFP
jgi:hypothetical protein